MIGFPRIRQLLRIANWVTFCFGATHRLPYSFSSRQCQEVSSRQCQEVDESISDVSRPRKVGGKKIAHYLAGASANGVLLRLGIDLEVSELVEVDRVTDAIE